MLATRMAGDSVLGRLIPTFWSNIRFRNNIRNEYKQMRSSLRQNNSVQIPFDFRDRGHRLGNKAEDVHLEAIRSIENAASDSEDILAGTRATKHTIPEDRAQEVEE
jgi:hypothetical protein